MRRVDVLVSHCVGLLGGGGHCALSIMTERQFYRGRNLWLRWGKFRDLFSYRFQCPYAHPHGQSFIFAQNTEQQFLARNVRGTERTGFVARKKDGSPRVFGEAFKQRETLCILSCRFEP